MQGTERHYRGSCHCGRVTFELISDLQPALRCNCSFCKRKGAVMVKAKEGTFRITGGEEFTTLYQANTMWARHYFCRVCGIYTFHNPRSNPQQFRVNAGCLEVLDPLSLEIQLVDGVSFSTVNASSGPGSVAETAETGSPQTIDIEVLPKHTDENGHLNNVQALEFLQRGRIDFYLRCGVRTAEGGDERFGTVVVNSNVNFRQECFAGETLRVTTRLTAVGGKSFQLAQEIRRPDGAVTIEGTITSVVMDRTARQPVLVPVCLTRLLPDAQSK